MTLNPFIAALPVINSTTHSINNGTITVAEGSNLTLRCEATGDEALQYRWTKNGRFGNVSNVRGKSRQNLIISNATISNNGKYKCQAGIKVSDRESSMNVQVTVKSKPL